MLIFHYFFEMRIDIELLVLVLDFIAYCLLDFTIFYCKTSMFFMESFNFVAGI